MVSIYLDITVAIAAPATPSFGIGPIPKMSRKSSTALLPTAAKLAAIGTMVCPVSFMFVAYACVTANGMRPIITISRYSFPYASAASVAPFPAVSVR